VVVVVALALALEGVIGGRLVRPAPVRGRDVNDSVDGYEYGDADVYDCIDANERADAGQCNGNGSLWANTTVGVVAVDGVEDVLRRLLRPFPLLGKPNSLLVFTLLLLFDDDEERNDGADTIAPPAAANVDPLPPILRGDANGGGDCTCDDPLP
jgi:hypothetical protein